VKRLLALALLLPAAADAGEIETAFAHPPFDALYACTEHFAGQLSALGDALGTDCTVYKLVEVDGRAWPRAYRDQGQRNEDWYGWNESVLSPCDCTIAQTHENPQENEPGVLGKPPASYITLVRADGVNFLIAHVRSISVRQGERVKAGQPIRKVGNNGYGRNPHIHIGAWKRDTPLQIRFDQTEMRLPREFRGRGAEPGAVVP